MSSCPKIVSQSRSAPDGTAAALFSCVTVQRHSYWMACTKQRVRDTLVNPNLRESRPSFRVRGSFVLRRTLSPSTALGRHRHCLDCALLTSLQVVSRNLLFAAHYTPPPSADSSSSVDVLELENTHRYYGIGECSPTQYIELVAYYSKNSRIHSIEI